MVGVTGRTSLHPSPGGLKCRPAVPLGKPRTPSKRNMVVTTARAPTRFYRVDETGAIEISARGFDVLHAPRINKGTAFTLEERQALGLTGLLPPAVLTIEQQAERAYELFRKQPDDLAKSAFLTAMQDRNETLFFHLLASHFVEMLPIVYTPTVGLAIQQYSHQYRRPRGIFLSIDRPDEIEEALLGCRGGRRRRRSDRGDRCRSDSRDRRLGRRRHRYLRRQIRRLYCRRGDRSVARDSGHARRRNGPAIAPRRSSLPWIPPSARPRRALSSLHR